MKRPYLSVIIPVYNEQKRLHTLPVITTFFSRQKFTTEIIFVDDGSSDKTRDKLIAFAKKHPHVRIIGYSANKGKGHAIRVGMLRAQGRYHLFMDVDLSTPLDTLIDFLPLLSSHDVVIGSRKTKGAKIKHHQPWLREFLGKSFTKFSQVLLRVPVSDFTCGFKAFSHKASKEIFTRSHIDRWGFDCEVITLAIKRGFSVKEVPVSWSNDVHTKVHFPRDIILSLTDLLRIKWYLMADRYTLRDALGDK